MRRVDRLRSAFIALHSTGVLLLPFVAGSGEVSWSLVWKGRGTAPNIVMVSTMVRHVSDSTVSAASAEKVAGVRMSSEELRLVGGLNADGSLHVCSGAPYTAEIYPY